MSTRYTTRHYMRPRSTPPRRREYPELPEATPEERKAQLRALRRRMYGGWRDPENLAGIVMLGFFVAIMAFLPGCPAQEPLYSDPFDSDILGSPR